MDQDTISRRDFLVTTTALVVVSSLPVPADAAPVTWVDTHWPVSGDAFSPSTMATTQHGG